VIEGEEGVRKEQKEKPFPMEGETYI